MCSVRKSVYRLPPTAYCLFGVLAVSACSAGSDDVMPRDVPREDARDGGATCDGGCGDAGGDAELTCCPNGCVDLYNDLFNCGTCDNECPLDQECQAGICYTPACNPVCTDRQECCPGNNCIDPMSDNLNCGDCGETCDDPLHCVGGVCQCGSGATARVCTPDQECCPSGCVDLETDANNCGACGASCGGLPCNAGRCSCGSTTCSTGQTCCDPADGLCADLTSDRDHCGGCDSRCDPNRSTGCVDGACMCGAIDQCPSGTTLYPLCHMAPVTPPHRCCSGECVRIDDFSCANCGQRCMGGTECTASVGLFSCTFSCEVPSG